MVYPVRSLVWAGILLFLFRLGARRRLRFELGGAAGVENLNRIAETNLEAVPHPDTLAYLLERLPPDAMAEVRRGMVQELLLSRALERYRLLELFYTIAIDGTGHLVFKERHCPNCLTQKHKSGSTTYYHPVLEAKLVCPNGLALSVGTEFIENTDGRTKQDCELAAFYRLLPKLRRDFPMLTACLLLDANYLNQNVMRMATKLRFSYIITFKEGSLPGAYSEFEALHSLTEGQTLHRKHEGLVRDYRWLGGLRHSDQTFNAFECVETKPNGKRTRFAWATNITVKDKNVTELSQHGGRLRWKIENEGFNTQKNQGYELEHAYSEHPIAAKNLYILLQIAHILWQLLEKGNLMGQAVARVFGSSRAFAVRLLEAFRNIVTPLAEWVSILGQRFQIRFDTS